MTLPTSGTISLLDLRGEFGDVAGGPISLDEFYRGGPNVAVNVTAGTGSSQTLPMTPNGGPIVIPLFGTIQLSHFFGVSAVLSPSYTISASTTSVNEGTPVTFTVNTQNVALNTSINWQMFNRSAGVEEFDFVPAGTLGPLTPGAGLSGTVAITGGSFANGSGTFQVLFTADAVTEGPESFAVRLTNPAGTIVLQDALGNPAASALITVNDTSTAPVGFLNVLTTTQNWVVPNGVTSIDVVLVGGGGSGGGTRTFSGDGAGGGGAGGVLYIRNILVTPGQSLLAVIGAGGAPVTQFQGNDGAPTDFAGYSAFGGGGGGGSQGGLRVGRAGASSGGGCGYGGSTGSQQPIPLAGSPPSGTIGQGFVGGVGVILSFGGGGGGASERGYNAALAGRGRTFGFNTPALTTISVGGGGAGGNQGNDSQQYSRGGIGGGGNGGVGDGGTGFDGAPNTGGGGGGSSASTGGATGGAGGSGVILIAYNDQIPAGAPVSSSGYSFADDDTGLVGAFVQLNLLADGTFSIQTTTGFGTYPLTWFSTAPALNIGSKYWVYVSRSGTQGPGSFVGGQLDTWMQAGSGTSYSVSAVAEPQGPLIYTTAQASSSLTFTISNAPGGGTLATIEAYISARSEGNQ